MPVKLMVFLHGTAIMHAAAAGRPRAERVLQSSQRAPSVLDFASYIPTEAAVQKVRAWQRGGGRDLLPQLASHPRERPDRPRCPGGAWLSGRPGVLPGTGRRLCRGRAPGRREGDRGGQLRRHRRPGDDRLRPGPGRRRCYPLRHRPRVRRPCRPARQHSATGRAMSGAPPATPARTAGSQLRAIRCRQGGGILIGQVVRAAPGRSRLCPGSDLRWRRRRQSRLHRLSGAIGGSGPQVNTGAG